MFNIANLFLSHFIIFTSIDSIQRLRGLCTCTFSQPPQQPLLCVEGGSLTHTPHHHHHHHHHQRHHFYGLYFFQLATSFLSFLFFYARHTIFVPVPYISSQHSTWPIQFVKCGLPSKSLVSENWFPGTDTPSTPMSAAQTTAHTPYCHSYHLHGKVGETMIICIFCLVLYYVSFRCVSFLPPSRRLCASFVVHLAVLRLLLWHKV